jgi:hypothetical protein
MSSIPRKGQIIINPQTQRPVKVGSRTWLKLVKDGLVEGRYSDPQELYEVKDMLLEGDDVSHERVETKIEELNQTLPPNQQAVRGRGRYKDKIVKRRKQPTTRELTQHTARTAARAVSENIETLALFADASANEEDLEAQLENLIMSEILGSSCGYGFNDVQTPRNHPRADASARRPRTAPIRGRPKKQPEQEIYETAPGSEYDDVETEEEYDIEQKEFYED